MTALTLLRSEPTLFGGDQPKGRREPTGETLADALDTTWRRLTESRTTACLLCGEPLERHVVATDGTVIAARCSGCGSELS